MVEEERDCPVFPTASSIAAGGKLGQGQLADVIHSGAVINNHTGNHCHWSEETYSMRLSNVNCSSERGGVG